jgi:hypothetical protein
LGLGYNLRHIEDLILVPFLDFMFIQIRLFSFRNQVSSTE